MADSAYNSEEVDPKDARNLANMKKALFAFMFVLMLASIGFVIVQSI